MTKCLLVAFTMLFATCSLFDEEKWPQPTRVQIVPYNADEHGRFVEVCFDRTFRKRESYQFEMSLTLKGGRSLSCSGITSYDISKAEQSTCQRYNVYVYCLGRHATATEREAADAVVPGAVPGLTIRMSKTYSKEGQQTFTFKNL